MSMESSELCQQNHIDNLFYLYLFIFSSADVRDWWLQLKKKAISLHIIHFFPFEITWTDE